jgi:hypothetical protein
MDEMKEEEVSMPIVQSIDGENISIIKISKEEVLGRDFNRLFGLIEENEKNPIRKGFASVSLNIDGWDGISNPNYEIEEIRQFFLNLFRVMPHFLYYISPMKEAPKTIIACLSDSPLEQSKDLLHPGDLGETVETGRLPGEIGYKMLDAIGEHVDRIGFEDEHEELPIIYQLIENSIKEEDRKCDFL